ncbi:MAG: hypothetical protein M0Z69_16015 [Actinomycetota bacterium]|nr:hypothetical protein [Actinomycetota bacterium]
MSSLVTDLVLVGVIVAVIVAQLKAWGRPHAHTPPSRRATARSRRSPGTASDDPQAPSMANGRPWCGG